MPQENKTPEEILKENGVNVETVFPPSLEKIIKALEQLRKQEFNRGIELEKAKTDILNELVDMQAQYISLLNKEINDLVGIAHMHGWASNNAEECKELRNKIREIEARYESQRTTA